MHTSRWNPSLVLAVLLTLTAGSISTRAAEEPKKAEAAPNNAAENAWAEIVKLRPPSPPAEWQQKEPSQEVIAEFRKKSAVDMIAAADKASDFYTKYPKDGHVSDARKREYQFLSYATQLGDKSTVARMAKLEELQLKDPAASEDERFSIRARAIQRDAMAKESEGMPAMMVEFEKGVRALQKEFPKRKEASQMLLMIAANGSAEQSARIAKELAASDAEDQIKSEAQAILKKADMLGKPFVLAFEAVDGRKVDLAKMKGKVVLIDFWATWCGPCVVELPNVKKAYETLNPKGFEIISLSFDEDKSALTKFIAKEKMPWPQFFDGKGWENKYGKEFGIRSIPAMWLVDKKGNLRDMNARGDLEKKVNAPLAE